MSQSYNPKEIEKKWQKKWEDDKLFESDPNDKEKLFLTVAFPYPSGAMHIGHGRTYTVPDVYARFKRMEGYNVLYPMGWDAFGLPTENFAIKNHVHPAAVTDFESFGIFRNAHFQHVAHAVERKAHHIETAPQIRDRSRRENLNMFHTIFF